MVKLNYLAVLRALSVGTSNNFSTNDSNRLTLASNSTIRFVGVQISICLTQETNTNKKQQKIKHIIVN
jgi:hypothetical protein